MQNGAEYSIKYKLETGGFKDGIAYLTAEDFRVEKEGKFTQICSIGGTIIGLVVISLIWGIGAIQWGIGGAIGIAIGGIIGRSIDNKIGKEAVVVFSVKLADIISVTDGKRKTLHIRTQTIQCYIRFLAMKQYKEVKEALIRGGNSS